VRAYRPVAPWHGAATLTYGSSSPGPSGQVVFVVEDALTGRPVQAAALRC
jgi:hypothetical protein